MRGRIELGIIPITNQYVFWKSVVAAVRIHGRNIRKVVVFHECSHCMEAASVLHNGHLVNQKFYLIQNLNFDSSNTLIFDTCQSRNYSEKL